ncbi:MAG: metallophosphoesterase [Planctomycetota bacterium]
MPRGFVIGDLHLFGSHSRAHRHLAGIAAAARLVDDLVINGDAVDFRWAQHPELRVTIEAACRWLARLCHRAPACQVHYVLGNHDAIAPWVHRLRAMTCHLPNLSLHETSLRLGEWLFLHGDLVLEQGCHHPTRRTLRDDPRRRRALFHMIYRLLTTSILPRIADRLPWPAARARRFEAVLGAQAPELLRGAEHLVFAHTHAPFRNHRHGPRCYHNAGSMIHGMRARPFTFLYHR